MSRRSSSSASTPSRIAPPSRATAGGSSTSVALERVAEIGEIVELRDQAAHQRRLQVVEQQPDARNGGDRLAQRDEIARTGGAERGAADQPLHVVDALERVAQLGALGAAERELLDGVEPILDPLERRAAAAAATRAAAGRPSA